MNKNSIILAIVVALISIASSVIISNSIGEDPLKIVYIDRNQLFQEFAMRKEMGKDFENQQIGNQKELDSINVLIDSLVIELKSQGENPSQNDLIRYNELRNYVVQRKEKIESVNQNKSMELTQQIWDRLNIYITEFGKEKGYDIIFGAAGEGNIMYGNKKLDITEDLISYCNEKYNAK